MSPTAVRALVLSVTLIFTNCAFAQNAAPPHVPLQKTIGATKPQVVPSLIVFNSKGATLQAGKLVLTGIAPNSIVFADRPVRSAGHELASRHICRAMECESNVARAIGDHAHLTEQRSPFTRIRRRI